MPLNDHDGEVIAGFAANLRGPLLRPGDADYDAGRTLQRLD